MSFALSYPWQILAFVDASYGRGAQHRGALVRPQSGSLVGLLGVLLGFLGLRHMLQSTSRGASADDARVRAEPPAAGLAQAGGAGRPDVTLLFREHGPFVFRVLRRLGVREADIDDALQEVFLVAYRRADTFEARSSWRTWLYGIAVRVAAAFRRKAHVRRETMESAPEQTDPRAGAEAELVQRQLLAHLDLALAELDDDKRAAFVLYEVEGMTMAEVAEALGCPLQTAYSRYRVASERVATKLRRVLGDRAALPATRKDAP
jgi:RNA polymerase sigma-70 factor (ECF subfamily)